jgi:hypothetical protein
LGTWRAFGGTNPILFSSSIWTCAASKQIGTNVVAQVCVVQSPDSFSVQPAVIVRNDKPVEYDATAAMSLSVETPSGSTFGYDCPQSGVAPHSWSVCFGNTITNPLGVAAEGEAGNNVDLGATSVAFIR